MKRNETGYLVFLPYRNLTGFYVFISYRNLERNFIEKSETPVLADGLLLSLPHKLNHEDALLALHEGPCVRSQVNPSEGRPKKESVQSHFRLDPTWHSPEQDGNQLRLGSKEALMNYLSRPHDVLTFSM